MRREVGEVCKGTENRTTVWIEADHVKVSHNRAMPKYTPGEARALALLLINAAAKVDPRG